jgi:hypothetical protein
MSDKNVNTALNDILEILGKKGLSVQELLVLYGNLGYYIGASIAGFQDKGPSLEEIKREYYSNPTVDVGLMLQGMIITTWEKDYLDSPKLSRWHEENIAAKTSLEKE